MPARRPAPGRPPTCAERLAEQARQYERQRRDHLEEDALRAKEDAEQRRNERFNYRLLVIALLSALVEKLVFPTGLFRF
jgi:hypothetical protein